MATYFSAHVARGLLLARAREAQIPLSELALAIGLPKRTLHRVLASRWLRWDIADRVSIALGHHPCELWPDWFDLEADVDLDVKEQAS
ncbi:MAG TPA: helix-turn-helix domain-containing protein [Frankiaceae bacterium]|nr:helix-turn-helix domain-containing protein [Frankiaceae bacterium]